MKKFKMTIAGRHEGRCQTCFTDVIGYDAKFADGFSAFLCKECMDKHIDFRIEEIEKADRPMLKC